MKYFTWNRKKNDKLKKERKISFEEIVLLIEKGEIVSIEKNPTRPNQKIYILNSGGYAVIVPFVENETEIFLKTAFFSRKYTKKYKIKEK